MLPAMNRPLKKVDQVIDEAIQAGQFRNLEGQGRPVEIDTGPDAVVRNLLKQADVKPEWVVLLGEIEQLRGRVRELEAIYARDYRSALDELHRPRAAESAAPRASWWQRLLHGERSVRRRAAPVLPPLPRLWRQWERFGERYSGSLHQLNRRIRRFNLICPVEDRQKPLVDVATMLERLAEAHPLPDPRDEHLVILRTAPVDARWLLPPPDEGDTPEVRRAALQIEARLELQRVRQPRKPMG